ncbi:hypothetical protein HMN09_01366500 [Mycena chlorophos]|uniref:Uncharacterized protein n=1 Tax=Mycena chlorophos TaxID=658473 RepID=A0A8H6RW28_MYCCL|nr:hypothetical protein HMN09_01366500 [Mycena chlorophos]
MHMDDPMTRARSATSRGRAQCSRGRDDDRPHCSGWTKRRLIMQVSALEGQLNASCMSIVSTEGDDGRPTITSFSSSPGQLALMGCVAHIPPSFVLRQRNPNDHNRKPFCGTRFLLMPFWSIAFSMCSPSLTFLRNPIRLSTHPHLAPKMTPLSLVLLGCPVTLLARGWPCRRSRSKLPIDGRGSGLLGIGMGTARALPLSAASEPVQSHALLDLASRPRKPSLLLLRRCDAATTAQCPRPGLYKRFYDTYHPRYLSDTSPRYHAPPLHLKVYPVEGLRDD